MGCCQFVGMDDKIIFLAHSRRESENNLNIVRNSVHSLKSNTQLQTQVSVKSCQILARNISQHFSEYSQDDNLNLPDVSSVSSIISWKKMNNLS